MDQRARLRRYVVRRTLREFTRHDCTDLAAGLVYHAAFAALPALLALVSLLGVIGQADATVRDLVRLLGLLAPGSDLGRTLEPALDSLARSPAAPFTFAAGLAGALWSASNYTAAFGRAMDRVWNAPEGRSYLVMRAQLAVVTVAVLALVAVGCTLAVVSTSALRAVADLLGLPPSAVTVYGVAKWPLLAMIAILVVAVLYRFTPNVVIPRLRAVSAGSVLALAVLVAASAGLVAYAAGFDRYETTYGAIGAVVLVLLWAWIANLALLLGAEFDAELERGRELARGERAEERIRLPLRDARSLNAREQQWLQDVEEGRAIADAARASAPAPDGGSPG